MSGLTLLSAGGRTLMRAAMISSSFAELRLVGRELDHMGPYYSDEEYRTLVTFVMGRARQLQREVTT